MTNVDVCTDGFTKRVGARVHYIDPEGEEYKVPPEPALPPQHHRRPWHDVLRADPGHR
jgi:hypothetical protein